MISQEELNELPAVVDVATAARVLGLSRTAAYALIRTGEWPTPVYRLGKLIRIPTAPMLKLLCVGEHEEHDARAALADASSGSPSWSAAR